MWKAIKISSTWKRIWHVLHMTNMKLLRKSCHVSTWYLPNKNNINKHEFFIFYLYLMCGIGRFFIFRMTKHLEGNFSVKYKHHVHAHVSQNKKNYPAVVTLWDVQKWRRTFCGSKVVWFYRFFKKENSVSWWTSFKNDPPMYFLFIVAFHT